MPKKRTQTSKKEIITPTSKRVEWVDIYKGLAIMLVVAGHAASPANIYIYEFHMAAFLFIAGFTNKLDVAVNGWQLFIKKWERLMWPFWSFIVFFSGLFFVLHYLKLDELFFGPSDPLMFIPIWHFNALTSLNYSNPLAGVSWFVLLLFETSLLGYFGYQTAKKLRLPDWVTWLISLAIFSLFAIKIWPNWPGTRINYSLDLIPICWMFLYSGFMTAKYQFFNRLEPIKTALISMFGIWLFANVLPLSNDYPPRQFSPFLFVLAAGLNGSLFLWALSRLVEKYQKVSNFLQYLGRHTMAIFFCHFAAFKVVSVLLIIAKLKPISQLARLVPEGNDPLWIIYFGFGLLLPLAIDRILRKHAITKKYFLGEA